MSVPASALAAPVVPASAVSAPIVPAAPVARPVVPAPAIAGVVVPSCVLTVTVAVTVLRNRGSGTIADRAHIVADRPVGIGRTGAVRSGDRGGTRRRPFRPGGRR